MLAVNCVSEFFGVVHYYTSLGSLEITSSSRQSTSSIATLSFVELGVVYVLLS